MAYEVIKRVSGRAYRYRVESFRDPDTRRVRGKWTYLGRVEGEGTLSLERKARPTSRERLLDALGRLLEVHDLSTISTGMIATEASLAYGTYYRHFRDVAHIVREAMVRNAADVAAVSAAFAETIGDAETERAKLGVWLRAAIDAAQRKPGLYRAWFAASNQDSAVVLARQSAFDAAVLKVRAFLEALNAAGRSSANAEFASYAICALVSAAVRDAAIDRTFSDEKFTGILAVLAELSGLDR